MVRRNTTLYVDDKLIQKAKALGINLSKFLESQLSAYIDFLEPESFIKSEIEALEEQIEKERKRLEKLKKREAELKQKLPERFLKECLKVVKKNPSFAVGQARLIENKFGLRVNPELLIKWSNASA